MKKFTVLIFLTIVLSMMIAQSLGDFQLPGSSAPVKHNYWLHKTFLKTVLIILFSILGLIALKISNTTFRYLVLSSTILINGFIMGGFLCPTTSVQNVLFKFATGYLVMFFVPILFSFVFGRIHCGFVCPYGAIQELLGFKAVSLPDKLDRPLKKLKYPILVILVILALIKGDLVLRYMPFRDVFNFEFSISTALWIVLSIVIYRPFCKYLCPYGALLSLASRFSMFGLCVDEERCVGCKICERKCKIGAIRDGFLDKGECLMCGSCKKACKVEAINFKVEEVEL